VPATSESPASFPHECLVGTKRELCETVEPSPLTLALSPNPRNGLGEREDIVGTLTQGGARGSCLALALGYNPPPRWGSTLKKRPPAASQMSNLERGSLLPLCNGAILLRRSLLRPNSLPGCGRPSVPLFGARNQSASKLARWRLDVLRPPRGRRIKCRRGDEAETDVSLSEGERNV